MSAHEEFNAVHKWAGEIFGRIKRKKLIRMLLAFTDLPTHVGKPRELKEGSSLKATLQGKMQWFQPI